MRAACLGYRAPGHPQAKAMSPLLAVRSRQARCARFGLGGLDEPKKDDRDLLASIEAREPGAAAALHRRAQRVIAQTVNRLLGKGDPEAEDLAQLAFIELLRTIANFGESGTLDAWVRVVSSRVVYKHIKRRQLERRLGVVPIETSRATARDFMMRDALKRVRRHLSRLDANRTFTFLLHDVYGYDMREVAHMTGVSVAAARTRLARGRREVRKRIFSDPDLASLAGDLRHGQRCSRYPSTNHPHDIDLKKKEQPSA